MASGGVTGVSIPPAGHNISSFIYISVYEPASNGAYFL
eukprot:COSAG01_NODE_58185_length_307_cov_1.471154_1_plen_37_part_10